MISQPKVAFANEPTADRGTHQSKSRPAAPGSAKRLSRYIIFPGISLLVVSAMVAIFLNRDFMAGLGNYGYLGAFLIGLVANATIFLPMPGLLLLLALGASFNPVLVGIIGAAGGAFL